MMSVCRNSVNSSFTLLPPPLPLLEEDQHFSHAFHQTLGAPRSPPPKSPSNLTLTFNPLKPISVTGYPPILTGEFFGEKKISGNINLMSCTESLGFESSDEMISSFDDLDFNNNNPNCLSFATPSSSSSSSNLVCLKRREKVWEEKKFPPPLTSLRENGRTNFILKKSVKEDGRLEIVGVMNQRPEILRATRDNGRLRLDMVRNFSDDEDEDDEETERENEEEEEEEETDEERDWRRIQPLPPVVAEAAATAGLRRCCQQYQVWGPQQQRCVTTI